MPGDEVEVEVSISGNPGIVGMVLGFEYDKDSLKLLDISESGLEGLWQKASGVVWISRSGDSKYNGKILTLKFKVLDNAPSGFSQIALKLDDDDICNNDMELVDFDTIPGGISIEGCSLSGTVVSWDYAQPPVVALYDTGKKEAEINSDICHGAGQAVYIADIIASDSGQGFLFQNLRFGNYKLAVYKPGGYAVKIKDVCIDGPTDMGRIKLWLYGDVVYDGVIKENDARQLQKYIVGQPSVFDNSPAEDMNDRLKAANVSALADGESKLDSSDVLQIERYLEGLPSVFEWIS